MAWTTPVLAWGAIWATLCGVVLFRGPAAPRVLAGALLAQLVIVLAVQPHEDHYQLSPSLALTDIALLVVAAVLAKRTRRVWAACATGLQGVAVTCHLAKLLDPAILSWAYLSLQALWSFGVLASVLWASFSPRVSVHAPQSRDG